MEQKLSPPPLTFRTSTVDGGTKKKRQVRGARSPVIEQTSGAAPWLFVKVTFRKGCLHSPCCLQCDRLLSSQHLTWLCFLRVPRKGSRGDSRLLVSASARHPLCNACAARVVPAPRWIWRHGIFLYCGGACPWRRCHRWKHRRGNSLSTSTHLDHWCVCVWCVWEFTPWDLAEQNCVSANSSLHTNKHALAKKNTKKNKKLGT